MCTSTNDKWQKYGKRVKFAIDNYIELLNSKPKDCHLNNLNVSEVDSIHPKININIHPKMLCFDRCSDNDIDCTEYLSKHRHLSFNKFDHNESQKNIFDCNAIKKYPSFKKYYTYHKIRRKSCKI